MDSILKSLKEVHYFAGITCPYQLFVTVYHLAFPHQKKLVERSNNSKEPPFLQVFRMEPFCLKGEELDLDRTLFEFVNQVDRELRAEWFLIVLLGKLDFYLAGIDATQNTDTVNLETLDILERLNDPNFYTPIEITLNGEKTSYQIAPRIPSLFSHRNKEELTHSEKYFSSTLAYQFLEHHTILKEGRVNQHEVNLTLGVENFNQANYFHGALEKLNTLVIGLAPFDRGFSFESIYDEKKKEKIIPFRYSRIKNPSRGEINGRLTGVLEKAFENKVDVLIFPELSVDHEAFTQMHQWLSESNDPQGIKLIITGGFHKEREEGGYVNQSFILDWQGKILTRHYKQKPFHLNSQFIEKSPKKDEILQGFDLSPGEELAEGIYTNYPITFLDTPIGRMSTLICLDFLLPQVSEILSHISCDYFWVPAMTTSIRNFENQARDEYGLKFHVLSACSASVSCGELLKGKKDDFSFLYAPSKKCSKAMAEKDVSSEEDLFIYKLDQFF